MTGDVSASAVRAPASCQGEGAGAVGLVQSYDPLNGETMPRMFGTDGVRGLANVDITADLALQLGEAAARQFGGSLRADGSKPRAIIGRDTRISGEFLDHALAAGLATMAFTTAISRTRTGAFNVITLVLGGVIVSALANAVLSLLKLTADPTSQLPEITYWLMGSLAAVTYHQIALGAPFIIAGVVIIVALRWQLNILSLSEDEARSAGVNVSLMRAILIIASTVITASVISMCGQVGWVGLLVPHCARMLCGQNNRAVIPVSLLLGSALMIVIDTLARSLSASEIPISILTAIIGAPFFIVLLRRTGGAR